MKRILPLFLLLSACNQNSDKVAENAVPPALNTTSETPGDWSNLQGMVGRQPGESGLLANSSITVDLNAMLGPELERYRQAMATGSPLVQEGSVLVSRSADGRAYLLIYPADHALEAGLRQVGGWRQWTTPGATIPRPASVQRLRGA